MKHNVRSIVAASLATGAMLAGGSALATALEIHSAPASLSVGSAGIASHPISIDAFRDLLAVSVDQATPLDVHTNAVTDAVTITGIAAGATGGVAKPVAATSAGAAGGAAKYAGGMAAGAAGGGAKYAARIAGGAAGGTLELGLATVAPTHADYSASSTQTNASATSAGSDAALSVAAVPVATTAVEAAGGLTGFAAGAAGGAAGAALNVLGS